MRADSRKFLSLLFNPGETICVSPNEFAYRSIPQENIDSVTLQPNNDSKQKPIDIVEDDILLVAINPISGKRNDKNVTSFRSFLVELDEGGLAEQEQYIEDSGLPYSACVFSGNKSLHYAVTLKQDLPESAWRYTSEWILKILSKADSQAKNPSRSIRFPGNRRRGGRGEIQRLIKLKERVDIVDLNIWLNKHPESKPVKPMRTTARIPRNGIRKIPNFVQEKLENGVLAHRNSTWFSMSCVMFERGYTEDETVAIFGEYFVSESDFSENEWLTCIRSAFKHMGEVHSA